MRHSKRHTRFSELAALPSVVIGYFSPVDYAQLYVLSDVNDTSVHHLSEVGCD